MYGIFTPKKLPQKNLVDAVNIHALILWDGDANTLPLSLPFQPSSNRSVPIKCGQEAALQDAKDNFAHHL